MQLGGNGGISGRNDFVKHAQQALMNPGNLQIMADEVSIPA